MRVICGYMAGEEENPGSDWAVRVNRLLGALRGQGPLRHYTKHRLMSAEARFGWVEMDLRPLTG
jgi:hypothetical protein